MAADSMLRGLLPVAVFLGAGALGALEVPYLAGRVNDLADLMTEEEELRVTSKLEGFERTTGAQIAVLTIPTLEGEVLEEYSLRVVETWGLGRAEQDDGVLLLVARDDRKMRIEVGYGLEGDLTDVQCGRILRNVLRPAFRGGEFGRGIEEGIDAILGTLEGREAIPEEPPQQVLEKASLPARLGALVLFLAFISLFAVMAVFSSGCGGWMLYLFLIPFMGMFPGVIVHPYVGILVAALWIVGFPILRLLIDRTAIGKRLRTRHFSGLSSGGWGSGGGFSSGGFSGGGGSFGGGGSSGSW